jgi:hypothetical protein
MFRKLLVLFLIAVTMLALSLATQPAAAQDYWESRLVYELDPAPVVEWMELLRQRVQAESVSAPGGARLYAYAGITVYEALLPGMPDNRSLSFQVQDLPELPYPEAPGLYDWLSSANGALSTVLNGLMYTAGRETHDAFNDLRERQAAARTEEVGEEIVERSLAYGDTLGQAILDWADADGYREIENRAWEIPTGADYLWEQTNPDLPPVGPYWGELRPFGVYSAYDCWIGNNMPFSTEEDSVFYQQAMEVMNTVDNLTPEQREIAEFWIDTPGVSPTPAGHWVSIMNQMVDQLSLTLDRAAMMYGMVGMVLGDSFITAWSQKYQELLLRPQTYINRYISRRWRSYLATPQFPEYPSGHSVVSAAAADMMTELFGIVPFTDRTHERDSRVIRSFMSFEHAADEAAISRLYGGIHYRTAIENGKRMGRCITEQTLNNIIMLPIAQGE